MIKFLPPRTAFISGAISDAATILPIDTTFAALIAANVTFPGDYFYFSIYEGVVREEVKATALSGLNLTIERAQGDTTAEAFTLAAKYVLEWTKAAIEDVAVGLAPVAEITVEGAGIASVDTVGDVATVTVEAPNFTMGAGLEVSGDWPNLEFALTNDGNCCAGEEEAAGVYTFVGAGIADVEEVGGEVTVTVPVPNFTGVNVVVNGTWPDFEFEFPPAPTGTVTSVAVGTGLGLTGSGSVNPTISLSNTGVAASTYGGIEINAQGQIVAVPPTLDPISVLTEGTAISLNRTGDSVEINAIEGAVGTVGVLALADGDAPLDETDETLAVSQKLLASVIAALEGTEGYGGQTYSGEADADYVTTLPTTAIALALGTGEKALVLVNATARGAVATDPVNFGLAVFSSVGAVRLQANKKINQNEQSMMFFIEGPFTDGLALKHTALGVGETMYSFSLIALKL
jgi:hypothetical protein